MKKKIETKQSNNRNVFYKPLKMRIISWNCNKKFKEKFNALVEFDADIIVVQEAEEFPFDYFSGYTYKWSGFNRAKGIGILFKNKQYSIPNIFNKNLIYYLPLSFTDFNIINVWSFGHRAKKIGSQVNGYFLNAFEYYQSFIKSKEKVIILGDFNNSIIWDETSSKNKFIDIDRCLHQINAKSAYHHFYKENFGQESQATFYHTKNINKKFHIDYAFIKGFTLRHIGIGSYDDWIHYSDHMPIILDIN